MRILSVAAANALRSNPVPLAFLVEMDLSESLFLNTSSLTLDIEGATYLGTGGLGKIDAIQETPAEVKQLQFALSGVPSDAIALALGEPVQGKAVRIKLAILDPVTYQVLATSLRWAGLLDVMVIEDGQGQATISVTAEHAGIDLQRPYSSVYSDLEQQRLFPGDLAFQYNADQVDRKIVWPAASYYFK